MENEATHRTAQARQGESALIIFIIIEISGLALAPKLLVGELLVKVFFRSEMDGGEEKGVKRTDPDCLITFNSFLFFE